MFWFQHDVYRWVNIVREAGPLFGGYLQEALASKLSRVLPNNCVLLPQDKEKTSLIVVERHQNLFFCPECDDCSVLNTNDKANVSKDHCKHTFVAKTLMDGSESTELNVDEKDKIFIVQKNPYFVAIVYPQKNRLDAKGASARPGVVVKTARMTKKRCRTCKGRENCHHLIIVRLAESENNQSSSSERLKEKENNARQTEFETDLVEGWTKRKLEPKGKSQSKNAKNPENFHGDHANVFNKEFQYPPKSGRQG